MKIVGIFAVVKNSLLSVLFEGECCDSFTLLFEQWNDVEYLENFFESNKADLQSNFFGDITVEEAVRYTLDEAERLEDYIKSVARCGKATSSGQRLDLIFKTLNQTDYSIHLVKSKAYGLDRPSWLRIYAIRIAENLYVVSGGAIKLTRTMNNRYHLLQELKKLDCVKRYLTGIGLITESDYEFIEISNYD